MRTADRRDPHEIEMTALADDGLALAGTLTLPSGAGPHPAVVLLHGSGRLDRESDAGRMRVGLGRALASALADRGIASFRYDRRGVGATAGDWLATGFVDHRSDAAAALRTLAGRPEIRAEATGVIGHSEGAMQAMWLAAHGGAAAAVLLAGPVRPGEQALLWQASKVADAVPWLLRPLLPVLRWWARRQLVRIKASTSHVARVGGVRINARWFREMLAYDPGADLVAIRVPVLAITGDKDVQVNPDDLDELARLVPGDAEIRRVPDLTHVLRRDAGPASIRSYGRLLRQPVDEALLDDVAGWLAQRLP